MPRSDSSLIYRVVTWGDGVRGEDDPDTRYCTMAGVAKVNTDDAVYAVANEFICGRLGTIIGLPIPPGAIVRTLDDGFGYVSLRFGDLDERPPPVNPNDLARDYPEVAAGVIVFDVWTRHQDRHDENLAYSSQGISPMVFDHDRALFGRRERDGDAFLKTNVDDPCVRPRCLEPVFEQLKGYYDGWCTVIEGLSEDVIWSVCSQAITAGVLTEEDGQQAYRFLESRKAAVKNWLSIGLTDEQQSFPEASE